jgi:hypothetical protein
LHTYIDRSVKNLNVLKFKLGNQGYDLTMSYNDYLKVEKPHIRDLTPSPPMTNKTEKSLNSIFYALGHKNQMIEGFVANDCMSDNKDIKVTEQTNIPSDIKAVCKIPEEEPSFLEMVYEYFENAQKYMDIPEDWLDVIKKPNITLKINLKVKMDNGRVR